jgi:hypothetical protein
MSDEMTLISGKDAKALCPWLNDSKVPIPLLSEWDDITRDSADWWLETKIGDKVANFFGTQMMLHSEGNFPDYDAIFRDGTLVEIKCSSFQNSSTIFVETHKEERNSRTVVDRKIPSGLSLSKADYYILLNPGKSKVGDVYMPVMKLRFIPADILKHLANTTVETSIVAPQGKRSYGFNIDLHDPNFEDHCLGHYKYDPDTKNVDLSSFVKYNKEIMKASDTYRKFKGE